MDTQKAMDEGCCIYDSSVRDGIEYIAVARFYTMKKTDGIWKITDAGTTSP